MVSEVVDQYLYFDQQNVSAVNIYNIRHRASNSNVFIRGKFDVCMYTLMFKIIPVPGDGYIPMC